MTKDKRKLNSGLGPDRPGRIRGWIADGLTAAGIFLLVWSLLVMLP